jgi:hypothetical protein
MTQFCAAFRGGYWLTCPANRSAKVSGTFQTLRRGWLISWLLEILKILLRDEALASDLDAKSIAKKTEGFSGSDLKRLFYPLKDCCTL